MGSSAINLTGPLGPEQFRNKLINGDFNFWQRGTSDTQGPASGAEVNSFYTYTCDRWAVSSSRGVGHSSPSPSSVPRVRIDRMGFTMGQPSLSDVSGSQYFMRVTVGAADGTGTDGVTGASMDRGNAYLQVGQRIESNNFGEWSGKTVWLSFLAKSLSESDSMPNPQIGCRIELMPDTDQTITGDVWPATTTGVVEAQSGSQTGFRRVSRIVGDNINLTPEWQKFKRKFVLPDFTGVTGGTNGGNINPIFVLISGASSDVQNHASSQVTDYMGLTSGFTGAFDVAQVQLEIGNDVSPFEKRHPQVELSMCQRYYEKSYNLDTTPGTVTQIEGGTDPGIPRQNVQLAPVADDNSTIVAKSTGVHFMCNKRNIPTVQIWSCRGGLGKASNVNEPEEVDIGATGIGHSGFHTGSLANYGWNFFYYTADAEL